jgi:hypothetical protein
MAGFKAPSGASTVILHTPTSSRENLLLLARPPSSPFRRTLKHQDNPPQSLLQPSHQTLCKAQNSTPHPPSRARHASPAQNRTSSTAWLRHSRAWPARSFVALFTKPMENKTQQPGL